MKRSGYLHRRSVNNLSDAPYSHRVAANQSQYLIYIMWSLAAISSYELVVRWRLGRPSTAAVNLWSVNSANKKVADGQPKYEEKFKYASE